MALIFPISRFEAQRIIVTDADGISKRTARTGDLIPVYVSMTSMSEYPQILVKAQVVITD